LKYSQAIELAKNGSIKRDIWKWTWEVTEQFVWYLNYEDKREYVVVPEWFKTNLGSVPRLMRRLIDYTNISFILHDWLYSEGCITLADSDIKIYCTRSMADSILREALKVEKVWFIKRWIIYLGVFLFWWIFYNK